MPDMQDTLESHLSCNPLTLQANGLASVNEHTYESLPLGAPSCRVLTLLPGTFHDDICIVLNEQKLEEGTIQAFEALSYTWGSKRHLQKIFVAPQDCVAQAQREMLPYILATENLVEVLRHIRHSHASQSLWIDAICVNQRDLKERSSQVQFFPLIFRSARHVLVWLGPEADGSSCAIERLHFIASKVTYDENRDELALKEDDEAYAWMTNDLALDFED